MGFDITWANCVVIVTPHHARLDHSTADAFRQALLAQIEAGYRCLVIDLGRVESIDTAGLGALISAIRRLQGDGDLRVCNLNPRVKAVFELTRLHRLIPVAARRQAEAIRDAPVTSESSAA